jgi:hypothetical protein
MTPGFLILPTFQGHRVQSSKRHQFWHVSLLFDLEQYFLTLCEHVSRHHLSFYNISARLNFKYGRQAAILEKNKVLLLMARSAPNLSNKYTWHKTQVFICPTFDGHRGQSSKCHH